jgi:hypothetical protein
MGFMVLTAVVVKIYVFWDIISCSQFESHLTFQRIISLPSSWLKNKPIKKAA